MLKPSVGVVVQRAVEQIGDAKGLPPEIAMPRLDVMLRLLLAPASVAAPVSVINDTALRLQAASRRSAHW